MLNSQMGDEDALQQLALMWYPKLHGYANRLISDEHLAKDMVQETLVGMCKNIRSIKEPVTFPKWLYRMLQNKCADAIHQRQKQRRILQSIEVQDCAFAQEINVGESFDLSSLDNESQQLVYLHYFDGFSLNDISHILDTPKGTLKSRLYSIRQQLKKVLEGEQK